MEPGAAADVAGALYDMGCYEVSMGDTIGIGTPATVTAMLQVGLGVGKQSDLLAQQAGSVQDMLAMSPRRLTRLHLSQACLLL